MAAIDAALKAGEKILSIYEDPKSDFEIERKADNSLNDSRQESPRGDCGHFE